MKSLKLKVIGTNSLTKPLEDKVFEVPFFSFAAKNKCLIDIKHDNKDCVFELKQVRFINHFVILDGFIAIPNVGLGRISFKYLPE